MRKTLIASLSVAALTLAACSSDNAGGSQGEVADLMIESAEDAGFELDEDCINEVTAKLSDEDAKKIVDAGVDGNPDVSEEADEIAEELVDCVIL